MGKRARTIVDLSLKELVQDINKVYCDEWLIFYLYWYISQTVSGRSYMYIRTALEKIAIEEFEHAKELMGIITALGDVPTANPIDLEKNSNITYSLPPKNSADINRIIRLVSDSEAEAIDVYNRLAKKTHNKDYNTHQVILHILGEEIKHEEVFENLMER